MWLGLYRGFTAWAADRGVQLDGRSAPGHLGVHERPVAADRLGQRVGLPPPHRAMTPAWPSAGLGLLRRSEVLGLVAHDAWVGGTINLVQTCRQHNANTGWRGCSADASPRYR